MTRKESKSLKHLSLMSPLRYPGSKRRLIPFIREMLQVNSLRPKLFVEPFAGGASVALQLLAEGTVEKVGLCDIDPLISSFWKAVFFDNKWFVEAITDIEVTLDNWYKFKDSNPVAIRDQALKCIFLNRTSFSGIMTSEAGPLGGKEQKSQYDIGCRFTKETIIKRVEQAGKLSNDIEFIWNCDWNECITKTQEVATANRLLPQAVFFYLDPPFFHKAKRLYAHYFNANDHRLLRDKVLTINYPWLLSYDAAKPIEELYKQNGNAPSRVEMRYSASNSSNRKRVQELIITNLDELP